MKTKKKTWSYVQFKNKAQSNKITHVAAAADEEEEEEEEEEEKEEGEEEEEMLMSLLGFLGLVLEQLQSLPGGKRSGFRSPKLFLLPTSCQRIVKRKVFTAWTIDLDNHDLLQDLVRETVSVSTLHKLHHTGSSNSK